MWRISKNIRHAIPVAEPTGHYAGVIWVFFLAEETAPPLLSYCPFIHAAKRTWHSGRTSKMCGTHFTCYSKTLPAILWLKGNKMATRCTELVGFARVRYFISAANKISTSVTESLRIFGILGLFVYTYPFNTDSVHSLLHHYETLDKNWY